MCSFVKLAAALAIVGAFSAPASALFRMPIVRGPTVRVPTVGLLRSVKGSRCNALAPDDPDSLGLHQHTVDALARKQRPVAVKKPGVAVSGPATPLRVAGVGTARQSAAEED
jgi:hypothetical protein